MPVPDIDCLTYRPQLFARTRARSSRSVTTVTFLFDPIAKAMTKIHARRLRVLSARRFADRVRPWALADGSV
eukprot:2283637-Rhodomonas_salina.1